MEFRFIHPNHPNTWQTCKYLYNARVELTPQEKEEYDKIIGNDIVNGAIHVYNYHHGEPLLLAYDHRMKNGLILTEKKVWPGTLLFRALTNPSRQVPYFEYNIENDNPEWEEVPFTKWTDFRGELPIKKLLHNKKDPPKKVYGVVNGKPYVLIYYR